MKQQGFQIYPISMFFDESEKKTISSFIYAFIAN